MTKVYTVLIGGKAGEGIKKAAQVVASVLMHKGWYVFQQDDYQSLIKGGHNFSSVSFSCQPVNHGYAKASLIISLDDRSLQLHSSDVEQGSIQAIHYYNSDSSASVSDKHDVKFIGLPLSTLAKQLDCKPGNISIAAVALFGKWFGLTSDDLQATIRKEFKRDVDDNIRFALEVMKLGSDNILFGNFSSEINLGSYHVADAKQPRLLSGNQAIALGAWAAGLDFYYAYPMTPASSILHYLALKQSTHKVYAIHAESELAAANMAIGSVFAGAKTAVGSSGGGFALMQEAFSLAGMVEAPLLCILSSRPGPATGVSTYTAQEDLDFALAQGHGEFARIVAAPDSISHAFTLAAELLCLAWEFQTPVILLCDKHISESSIRVDSMPHVLSADDCTHLLHDTSPNYERYAITERGISPLLFPGDAKYPDAVIKWNSHEHLPSGLRTDKAEAMVAMKDKRLRKTIALNEATKSYTRIHIYGDEGIPIFAYGSGVMELLEAKKHCSVPFRIISLIYLLPFPTEELQTFTGQSAIVLEHSSTGSLAKLLRLELGIDVKCNILRYDGRPWDPYELAELIEDKLNA